VTQPFDPRRLGGGNVQANVLRQMGVTGPGGAPAGADPATSWIEEQRQQAKAIVDERVAEQVAELEAQKAKQEGLEGDYSKAGTFTTQVGRGVLDVILAPGALLGAGVEGVGELADSDTLRDFGRGLGEASQGDEFISALNPGTLKAVFGGEPEEGLSEYEAMKGAIRDQEEAWPMLASTSRLGGSVAAGVGVGSLASGAAKLATTAGVAAYEGGAYGAQSAYAQNASLKDVLTSTLIGAAVGGAMPVGLHYGGKYAAAAAKDGLAGFAERRAVKAVAGNYRAAYKDISRRGADPERVQRIGRKLLDRGVDLGDLDDSILGIAAEKAGAADALQGVATKLDGAGVRVDSKAVLAQADEQIAELRKIGLGTYDNIADRLESEIAGFRRSAEGPAGVFKTAPHVKVKGGSIQNVRDLSPVGGHDMSFSEFWKFRRNFDDIVNFEKVAKGPAEKAMTKLRGTLDDALDGVIPPKDKAAWLAAKDDYGDFVTLEKAARNLQEARGTNRVVSPSDQGWGGTAMLLSVLGGDVSGLSGLGIGAAVTGAHKFLRETGSGRIARVADRISKSLTHHADEAVEGGSLQRLFGQIDDDARHVISVEAAGGREAQGVIADLHKARKAAQAAAEKAGANPAARHAAFREASEELRAKLAKKTGPFNPIEWSAKSPTPLQKVFHRSQILDQVADDTVAAVGKVYARKPHAGFELDARKLTKLLKDADGPAAIGGLQQRLRSMAVEAPKTADGDLLRSGLAKAAHGLEKADLPGTMAEGHRLTKQLLQVAENAPDDLTKGWAQRQARALIDDLGSERFGQAGTLYREAMSEGSERFAALGDRTILREALRTADVRGKLGAVVREHSDLIARATDAQSKLAGVAKPKELVRELRDLETLVSKAEEAVTLDGGPVGRVFEFFKNKMEDRVAAAAGGAEDIGAIVSKFVRPKLEKVAKHAKGHGHAKHGLKEKVLHTTHHAAEHTAVHSAESSAISPVLKPYKARAASAVAVRALSRAEQQTQYAERMQTLQSVAFGDDPDTVEEGVAAVDAIAPGLGPHASAGMAEKTQNLLRDMPKPPSGVRGRPEEALSSNDLRLSNAMWEATMQPMSVFDDFESGDVDYDKVQYAWKQYPGLHHAAQMGLMDVLHGQMSDEEREAMPDSLVTQLDNLFQMEGSLSPTIARDFSRRIDQAGAAEEQDKKQPPPQGASLKLPGAQASFTQRLSGQR
jgi:hypothetical protein